MRPPPPLALPRSAAPAAAAAPATAAPAAYRGPALDEAQREANPNPNPQPQPQPRPHLEPEPDRPSPEQAQRAAAYRVEGMEAMDAAQYRQALERKLIEQQMARKID